MMRRHPFQSWLIELQTAKMEKPLQVIIENRVILGRKDTTGNNPDPDVDLGPYDAENMGVSRHHLEIFVDKERLQMQDLGSGNGTLLNGVKLESKVPHILQHEDHVQLGHMKMDVRIIITPSYGSTMHKQTSLQLHDTIQPADGQLIQIVEDDDGTARLLCVIMEHAGFKAMTSRDVQSGIRAFNQNRPAAAIVDMMLPSVDGLEFVRYVRRDVKNHNTMPIVTISAYTSREAMENALAAGANLFLAKPINANELTHVVTSLVAFHENGVSTLKTKYLVGTAPLKRITPETRRIAAVLFVTGFNDKPIVVNLSQPVSFGRLANKENKHHVDLSSYSAVDHGVSRVHMFLHHENGEFFVEDNHTVNGTFVNGEPSKAGERVRLENGDEIRLGKLRTYIYFLTEEDTQEKGR